LQLLEMRLYIYFTHNHLKNFVRNNIVQVAAHFFASVLMFSLVPTRIS
jgi:hypothetical protein